MLSVRLLMVCALNHRHRNSAQTYHLKVLDEKQDENRFPWKDGIAVSSEYKHINSERTKLWSKNNIRRHQGRKLIYNIFLKMGNPKGRATECGSSLTSVTSFIENNHNNQTIRYRRNPCVWIHRWCSCSYTGPKN